MTEVAPGIFLLRIPIPEENLKYINAYLVRGDSGHLLVDTGWNTDDAFASLQQQLSEIGMSIKDISRIAVTHIHPDHYGLVGRLKELTAASVCLHRLEQERVTQRYINIDSLLKQMSHWLEVNGTPPDQLPELKMASVPMVKYVAPVMPDCVLKGGETITVGDFNFQVLWTPGHSPGHICLYEPSRSVLLSGDHILPTISPNVGLHPQSSVNPLGDYIASLKRLKRLNVDLVLPGHESPFHGLNRRIDELLRHHEARMQEIMGQIDSTPRSAYDVANRLTWLADIGGAGWHMLSPINRRLAILETIAHLELMASEGKIEKLRENGIVHYRRS